MGENDSMEDEDVTDDDVLSYLSMDEKTWEFIKRKCGKLYSYLLKDVRKMKSLKNSNNKQPKAEKTDYRHDKIQDDKDIFDDDDDIASQINTI